MRKLLRAEIKKMRSVNIWWLVIAGGILPGIIACLTLYSQEKVEWPKLANLSLLSFNVQSLLTFAAFTTYMWAREYEENTIELVLCYPYKRFYLVLVKLIILFFVIVFTVTFFFFTTLITGNGLIGSMLPKELLFKLLKALSHTGIMHFLLIPMYFCIAMISKISISGLIFGIANMCICFAFSHTSFAQYIPQCIPYVIGDKLLGMNTIAADYSLWVYYFIIAAVCTLSLMVAKVLADRLKK